MLPEPEDQLIIVRDEANYRFLSRVEKLSLSTTPVTLDECLLQPPEKEKTACAFELSKVSRFIGHTREEISSGRTAASKIHTGFDTAVP